MCGRGLILLDFSAGEQFFLVCMVVSLYGGALEITASIGSNRFLHCLYFSMPSAEPVQVCTKASPQRDAPAFFLANN